MAEASRAVYGSGNPRDKFGFRGIWNKISGIRADYFGTDRSLQEGAYQIYSQRRENVDKDFSRPAVYAKTARSYHGAGKGYPVGYVAVVKPGRVLFEIDGLPKESASEALRKAQAKLPVKTKQISRE